MSGYQHHTIDAIEPSKQGSSERKPLTPLQQGNAALRSGQYAAAIRHYALGLLDHHNQPQPNQLTHHLASLTDQLAQNLLLARKRYRHQRQSSGQLKVAVACWSLSENPAGRAHTLASLYQDLAAHGKGGIHGVALIGSLFARRGRELWAPIRNTDLPVHSILVEDDHLFMAQTIDLVSAHPVDLLHSCKLRFPNILFGLLYKLLWDAQVLVDIDDDELAFVGGEPLPGAQPSDGATSPSEQSAGEQALAHWLQRYNGLPAWRDLSGRPWTELSMSFCNAFDGITVANRALQKRHGGSLIRHARDPRQFQPSAERRARARAHWQIRPEQQVVIFLGTPRRHKGLLETAQALASLNRAHPAPSHLLYLIVGRFPASEQQLQQALEALHASGALSIRLLEDQPFAEIPDLLAAADLAVFMQDPDSAAACAQTPAKLSDALAMGLTVLAEPTPGLADLAEQGAFIPVDRAQLPAQLAAALQGLRPTDAHSEAGPDTRAESTPPQPHPVFTRELSLAVNRERLRALLDASLGRVQPPAPALRRPGQRGPQPLARALTRPLARLAALPSLGPLPRALLAASLGTGPAARVGVSIIILSLRGAELLERLLSSFLAHNSHQPVELIIVDHGDLNATDDPTAAVIGRYRAELDLWHLPRGRNHSFSDSCNLAAAFARYPNLLFLNNDIVYTSDALPAALQRLNDPRIGAVGIRLDDDSANLPPGQTPSVQHLGIEFVWNAQRGYHQPQQIRAANAPSLPADAGHEQPAVTGAFLLCRKADFDQLGGLSTEYDYGLEDIDLCLRLQRDLGKVSWCLTSLSLQHGHMTTRRRDPDTIAERIQRNHTQFRAHWAVHLRGLARSLPATDTAASLRTETTQRQTPITGLNLIGHASAPLGLGEVLRQAAYALRDAGIPFCIIDIPIEEKHARPDTLAEHFADAPRFPVSIFFMSAFSYAKLLENKPELVKAKYRIGNFYWEVEDFPASWQPVLQQVDELWTPTDYVTDIFKRAGFEKVYRIPTPVARLASRTGSLREQLQIAGDSFVFGFMFDLHSTVKRKNLAGLLAAYRLMRAQAPSDLKTDLLIKIHRCNRPNADYAALKDSYGADQQIHFVEATLSAKDVILFYNSINAYVSLHRSEGLGLTLIEAAQLGLPVICTNYSGSKDIVELGCAMGVRSVRVPCLPTDYPRCEGSYWSEPDSTEAADLMLKVAQQPAQFKPVVARLNAHFSNTTFITRLRQRLDAVSL